MNKQTKCHAICLNKLMILSKSPCFEINYKDSQLFNMVAYCDGLQCVPSELTLLMGVNHLLWILCFFGNSKKYLFLSLLLNTL